MAETNNNSKGLTRRKFIQQAGLGTAALMSGGLARAVLSDKYDVRVRLTAAARTQQIFPGSATNVYSYSGLLRLGPRETISRIPNSYLGPTFRLWKGQRVQIDFVNQLSEPCVTHFHGMHVPQAADGHPMYTIDPGQVWSHQFEVINRAGTYWYHAHTDMRTGFQVNRGLAGLMIVHDKEEQSLPLPRGAYDVPLVIQDRRINTSNQFLHSTGSQSGHLGDKILVNGYPNYSMPVASRAYRLRILNGSNSRIYKLAFSDGTPMVVIGTAGGLLETPKTMPYVMLGPGDRIEVWADFSNRPLGTEITLRSLAFMNGGPGSGTPPQGTQMDLMKFVVSTIESEPLTLPSQLTSIQRINPATVNNPGNPRTFALEYMGMWTINGNTFEMTGVSEDEEVKIGTTEMWEFRNDLNTGLVQPHPMHLHGNLFQIHRRFTERDEAWYDTIREGYVDEGWHDSILLFPGERVEFLNEFTHYTGLFLYHCHNLEHEDMGMMRNYRVKP